MSAVSLLRQTFQFEHIHILFSSLTLSHFSILMMLWKSKKLMEQSGAEPMDGAADTHRWSLL